jgi:hypothetical protein
MALLGGNEKEKARKANLKELEDKRIAFAEAHRDLVIDSALFVQFGGGFKGVGVGPKGIYLFTGPGPGDQEDFTVVKCDRCRARLRDEKIASEGAAGILGFGKKGGQGYTLTADLEDQGFELTFVSGYNFLLEVAPGTKNPLLDTKRRPGNANIVWDMRSITYADCQAVFARWHKTLNEYIGE